MKNRFDDRVLKPERITLEVKECFQQLQLSRYELQCANVDFHTIVEHYCTDFLVRMRARMAGQRVERHRYPTTWLDAFKARWFPKWLLKRLPVNYTTVETWHCYPEYPLPAGGNAIQYLAIAPDPAHQSR